MDSEALKRTLHLSASTDHLDRLQEYVRNCLNGLDDADRIAFLLLAERETLAPRGHLATLKFGASVYSNAPKCVICGGKVARVDRNIIWTSRLESSQIWITYHDGCVDDDLLEFDYDILSGEVRSPIGLR